MDTIHSAGRSPWHQPPDQTPGGRCPPRRAQVSGGAQGVSPGFGSLWAVTPPPETSERGLAARPETHPRPTSTRGCAGPFCGRKPVGEAPLDGLGGASPAAPLPGAPERVPRARRQVPAAPDLAHGPPPGAPTRPPSPTPVRSRLRTPASPAGGAPGRSASPPGPHERSLFPSSYNKMQRRKPK